MLKNDFAAFVAERLATDLEFYEMVQQELEDLQTGMDQYFDELARSAEEARDASEETQYDPYRPYSSEEEEVLDQYDPSRRF